MTDWIVRMDVFPQPKAQNGSLPDPIRGRIDEEDIFAVGGLHRTFNVQGEEILDAHAQAELIIIGIKTNPRVWRCHITAIEKTRR